MSHCLPGNAARRLPDARVSVSAPVETPGIEHPYGWGEHVGVVGGRRDGSVATPGGGGPGGRDPGGGDCPGALRCAAAGAGRTVRRRRGMGLVRGDHLVRTLAGVGVFDEPRHRTGARPGRAGATLHADGGGAVLRRRPDVLEGP
ncbi:hypothetical protein SDC9_90242 [bioreactor metagenome]|uniref:Uncharacterized protein n=1 Tax=bioreactor metagenome TaxID=1076179 RepID=A0A644ZRR1_9ZZZZ